MLIKFESEEGLSVLMFDDIAAALLKVMGMSGEVPGRVQAKDIPAALSRLQAALSEEKPCAGDTAILASKATSERVHLAARAQPLIELFENAGRRGGEVAWDRYHPSPFLTWP